MHRVLVKDHTHLQFHCIERQSERIPHLPPPSSSETPLGVPDETVAAATAIALAVVPLPPVPPEVDLEDEVDDDALLLLLEAMPLCRLLEALDDMPVL